MLLEDRGAVRHYGAPPLAYWTESTQNLRGFPHCTIQDMDYVRRPTIQELQKSILSLADAVRKTGTGDATFQTYLRFIANFPRLSAANSLLVCQQRPTATFTKGFKGWQSLGRSVKRGERAVWIFAPVSKRRVVEVDVLTGEESCREWHGYKAVPVFDVAQTVGPVWQPPNYTLDLGEHVQPVNDALIAYANSMNMAVDKRTLYHSLNGFFSPTQKHIVINENLPVGVAAQTLTHEVVHALLAETHEAEELTRGMQELETQAVTAVVWMRLGYDPRQVAVNSAAYISGWGGKNSAALILRSMNRIAKTASTILDGLLAHMPQGSLLPDEQAEDAAAMEISL